MAAVDSETRQLDRPQNQMLELKSSKSTEQLRMSWILTIIVSYECQRDNGRILCGNYYGQHGLV